MKLLVCLNNDLMSNVALNLLLPSLEGHDVHIFLSRAVGTPKERIQSIEMSEHDFPINRLFPALESQSAQLEARPNRYLTFNEAARFYHFSCEFVDNVNSEEGLEYVRSLTPDLVISIRYGQIFKDDFIAIPRLGILNLHSGHIPSYRGILATFWAMLHDEIKIGATLHWIDTPQIDAGPIVAKSSFNVHKERSLLWHVYHLYDLSVPLISKALDILLSEQDLQCSAVSKASPLPYFSYPTPEEVQTFEQKGYTLFDNDEYEALLKRYEV